MKKRVVYSRSARSGLSPAFAPLPPEPPLYRVAWNALRRFTKRHERAVLLASGPAAAVIVVLMYSVLQPAPAAFTQRDIDAAVTWALYNMPPEPALATVAYSIIAPSVVRVDGVHGAVDAAAAPAGVELPDPDRPFSTGSGVIISEDGLILTNLHVVSSAPRLMVTFADGTRSEADIVGAQTEHDLAVIQARNPPEELIPAILATTADLFPGDDVIAVGFPFGIGPSVSAGVVSGLDREFVNRDGGVTLTNLIQFDAAANPGNSGGPLVNRFGEVVGIVTAILSPRDVEAFAGIGFAVPIENAAGAAGRDPF